MKTPSDRFRDPGLAEALDAAISGGPGSRAPLYDRLRRLSGLPGPRMNTALVKAFAAEVASRGAAADPLISALRALHEDVAPFGHVDEFLAVLGVAATGARAATDAKARKKLLEDLEEASCDERSRLRDEVSTALVDIARVEGPSFASTLQRWLEDDQPYLARAVAAALGDAELLSLLGPEVSAGLVNAAFERVAREHRGGRRHDGFRRLVRAIETAFPVAVARFSTVAEVVERQAANEDEDVTGAVAVIAKSLKGRAQDRGVVIDAALAAAKKPSRDPRWDRLPGKRGRGR
ncbi:MAG: hypothetical protein ACXWUG_09700 [Polyangiales bacterium]